MAHHGKRVKSAREGIEPLKLYPLDEAVKLVKSRAGAKFDETVEVAMNLGVDPASRRPDGPRRLPVAERFGPDAPGRRLRQGRQGRRGQGGRAPTSSAPRIWSNWSRRATIEFDRCIATPDMMPLVGRLGKILGPRGMMPNPKVGTVTQDVAAAVEAAKGGAVEFRVEKAGIVHAGIGKASFNDTQLVENIKAFTDAVQKARPAGAKGTFVQRVAISSTMGPGVKVDPATLGT